MTQPSTRKLAAKLLEKYAELHSWRAVAADMKIVTMLNEPDPGMAWRIAHGYEPRRPETRRRLGLSPIRKQRRTHLYERSVKELVYMFDHRQEYNPQ